MGKVEDNQKKFNQIFWFRKLKRALTILMLLIIKRSLFLFKKLSKDTKKICQHIPSKSLLPLTSWATFLINTAKDIWRLHCWIFQFNRSCQRKLFGSRFWGSWETWEKLNMKTIQKKFKRRTRELILCKSWLQLWVKQQQSQEISKIFLSLVSLKGSW